MEESSCSITIKAGLRHGRRAVAILTHTRSFVNAADEFDALSKDSDRHYRRGFDLWIGGARRNRRFHGFDEPGYRKCFTFKHVDAGERFYGFLCRPKEPSDAEFEMCVLVCRAKKKTDKTDPVQLDRSEAMRKDPMVLSALKDPNLFKMGVGKSK